MNKSELIETVAGTAGLDKKQAEAAVGAFVDSVIAKAKSGEAVSIFGFGTFKPTARAARMGRNPQTGVPVKIAASKSVKFAPATAFKTALNPRSTKKAAAAKKATATKAGPAKKAATSTKKVVATVQKTAAAAKKSPAAKKVTAPAKKVTASAKKR